MTITGIIEGGEKNIDLNRDREGGACITISPVNIKGIHSVLMITGHSFTGGDHNEKNIDLNRGNPPI